MANELNIDFGQSGLTVTATLVQGNAVVGSPITLTESVGAPGFYFGNMPSVPEGIYSIRFSGGVYFGIGEIDWDGTQERLNPTAIQIRTEIDTNSIQLTDIKTIATAAKNNAAANL